MDPIQKVYQEGIRFNSFHWMKAAGFFLITKQGQKRELSHRNETHLKLVLENTFLDYKNTKCNTKILAHAAKKLQHTNISDVLRTILYHNHHEYQVIV